MNISKPKFLINDLILSIDEQVKLFSSSIEKRVFEFVKESIVSGDKFLFPSNFNLYYDEFIFTFDDLNNRIFNSEIDNVVIEVSDDDPDMDFVISILSSSSPLAEKILYSKAMNFGEENYYLIFLFKKNKGSNIDSFNNWILPYECFMFMENGDKKTFTLLNNVQNMAVNESSKNELRKDNDINFFNMIFGFFFSIMNLLTHESSEEIYINQEKLKHKKNDNDGFYKYKMLHYFFKKPEIEINHPELVNDKKDNLKKVMKNNYDFICKK